MGKIERTMIQSTQYTIDIVKIQFHYKGLPLQFKLNLKHDVIEIKKGINGTILNPMSRDFLTYKTLLKSKLGYLIEQL